MVSNVISTLLLNNTSLVISSCANKKVCVTDRDQHQVQDHHFRVEPIDDCCQDSLILKQDDQSPMIAP
jgi:hypothetical protein